MTSVLYLLQDAVFEANGYAAARDAAGTGMLSETDIVQNGLALAARSGIPMGDLAAQVFVDSPMLTKIVDKMVASADVFRGPDPNDRRRVLVFLSEKGSATFSQLASIGEGVERSFTQSLGAAALNDLSGLLRSVLRESRRPAADKSGCKKSHDTLAFGGPQEV